MSTAYKMPPIPEPYDMDSDSGEGGRGGAIWHTTDELIAYAAPLGAEIVRLQSEISRLEEKKQTLADLAEANNRSKLERIARLQAQVDALAVALASSVEAIDLLEDSILGVRRNWTPDGDGYYSLQPHKEEMDRLTKAKKQGEAALNAAGR